MKKEGELRNQLKAVRTRLSLSQQDLATAAGVARQTIGGIESGTYALSLTVALHLAKTLGCPVEELFWLEQESSTVAATPILPADTAEPVRVALAQVDGRWVASPLVGEQSTRREMIPADGIGSWNADREHLAVQLLDTPEVLAQTLFVAGCTPALSLWIRSAERWHPGLRVHWLHASSMAALTHLAQGHVHLAGVHLFDPVTGVDNLPFVQKALPSTATALVNLGTWEEGLLVVPGNPKRIKNAADLTRTPVRLVNRETGAGSRALLDWFLSQEDIPTSTVTGYDTIAGGHLDVAQAVLSGVADVGVSTASVAQAYGLDFLPLRSVRYDLALRKETLSLAPMQQLLGTLHHRWVRSQLATLGGYDTTRTGEITEVEISGP